MLRNRSGCPTPLRGPRAASPRRRFSSYLPPEAWDRQRLGGSSVLSPQLLQEVTARPCLAQDTARARRKPKPKARGPGYSNTPAGLGGRRAETRGTGKAPSFAPSCSPIFLSKLKSFIERDQRKHSWKPQIRNYQPAPSLLSVTTDGNSNP